MQKRKERDAKKKNEEREELIRKGNVKTWNQPRQGTSRQMDKRRGGVGTSCTE